MSLLRLLGGGLVVVSAIVASGEYSAYAKRRILHYEGLIALFSHAEGMISRFLASGDGLLRGFENEELEKVGMLSILREGEALQSAFEKCESRLALSVETKERIKDFLSTVGRGYREGEVASFSAFITSLKEEMSVESERLDKSVKVTRALLIGGSLAFLIMII